MYFQAVFFLEPEVRAQVTSDIHTMVKESELRPVLRAIEGPRQGANYEEFGV